MGAEPADRDPMLDAPVQSIAGDDPGKKPEQGTALCLSGGGYRAMLFHLGALWRLYETNLLKSIKRISSVLAARSPLACSGSTGRS
jgi:predicted acylesterase/phospholipase RssA